MRFLKSGRSQQYEHSDKVCAVASQTPRLAHSGPREHRAVEFSTQQFHDLLSSILVLLFVVQSRPSCDRCIVQVIEKTGVGRRVRM